jgi:hypothetical protein
VLFNFFVHAIVPGCRHCFLAISSLGTLSVIISLRYRIFLPVCLSFCEGLCSAAFLFGCSLRNFLSGWGYKTRFDFSDCAPGEYCWCCPDFDVFLCLVKFWQRHATVLLSLLLACSFPVFACVYSYVCSGKVTFLYVCVCVCVCFY